MPKIARGWINSPTKKLLLFIAAILVVSSTGFYLIELRPRIDADFFTAFWWTVVTLTTVGYGDVVPATTAGRILGLFVMLAGIGLVSTLTGNLASIIVERHAKRRKGLLKVKLTGHTIIIGWNSYAEQLVRSLRETGVLDRGGLVLVNQLPPEEREALDFDLGLGDKLQFVFGNPAMESVIHRAGPTTARIVYILAQAGLTAKEADQQSLYAALTLRSMAPKVPIYSEVTLAENHDHLLRSGVNEIVPRGQVTSLLLGMMGSTPSVWPFFQSLVGTRGASRLGYRRLSHEEKQGTWRNLLEKTRDRDGSLPLALCHESKELTLQDMLDEGSALDQFILELFTASGQQTSLGKQGPGITVNPADSHALESYDGLLYLKPEPTA